jgi:RNA polymerase sigma-70 factor (ECF subfamily)
MSATSISLLEELRWQPNEPAWHRLVDLYTPLIRVWLARYSVRNQDVEDLVQEVLAVVVRKVPDFERNPRTGSFRRWLRSITVNCLRDFYRARRWSPKASHAGPLLDQLEDSDSPLSKLWAREHDEHVTRRLLAMIRPRFQATTWLAFQRVVLEGVPVDQVAAELKLTANAVFIAKSRVIHMLREEGRGLID